jgi:hypothetical protein
VDFPLHPIPYGALLRLAPPLLLGHVSRNLTHEVHNTIPFVLILRRISIAV